MGRDSRQEATHFVLLCLLVAVIAISCGQNVPPSQNAVEALVDDLATTEDLLPAGATRDSASVSLAITEVVEFSNGLDESEPLSDEQIERMIVLFGAIPRDLENGVRPLVSDGEAVGIVAGSNSFHMADIAGANAFAWEAVLELIDRSRFDDAATIGAGVVRIAVILSQCRAARTSLLELGTWSTLSAGAEALEQAWQASNDPRMADAKDLATAAASEFRLRAEERTGRR